MAVFRRRENELFDGTLLGNRLHAVLSRIDSALAHAAGALENHELHKIEVSLAIDAGLNVSFAGIGNNLDRTRTLTFTIKPKANNGT